MADALLNPLSLTLSVQTSEAFAAPAMSLADRASRALESGVWGAVMYIVIGLVAVLTAVSVLGLVMSYIERKVAGHFQCRLGPMRVGPHGVLQSLADGIKLLFKEGIEPGDGDKVIFIGAPIFSITATILLLAIVPLAPGIQVVDMNVGVVYIAAVSGLGVMGILMGGWSSNNKWSLLGAMRAGAQMISYEVSLTIALLVVVLFSGTLKVSEIIESQQQGWWIWRGHGVAIVAFCLYVIASTAELNRTPFDLPEGESELTGGYHTEYSGLRFSFFFLAEFANLFVFSALAVTFFFGGWLPFHVGNYEGFNAVMDLLPPVISPMFWFGSKCALLIFVLMWFRWTFPRLRMDQLMRLEWKVLLPIGFVNLIVAATIVLTGLYFFPSAT
nr:NADH-quinone oxidoreductase subunit NuoH [Rhodopirellula sp. SM50]